MPQDGGATSRDDDEYREAIRYIWVVGGSILIVIGTVGNLLALAVLTRPKLRRSNAAAYLMVVAVTDLAVLYTGLLRQIIYTSSGKDIREDSEFSCKLHTALVYFFLDFSAWLLAALSLERLFSVCWPHKVRQKCTRMTSICVITGIGVTLFAINAHFFFTVGNRNLFIGTITIPAKCVPLSEDFHYVLTSVWPWVDLSVFALLPLTIHIVCNIFIVRRVVSSFQESRRNWGFGSPGTKKNHTSSMGCAANARVTNNRAGNPVTGDRCWLANENSSSRRVTYVSNTERGRERLSSAVEESHGPALENAHAAATTDSSKGLSERQLSFGTANLSVLTDPEAIGSGSFGDTAENTMTAQNAVSSKTTMISRENSITGKDGITTKTENTFTGKDVITTKTDTTTAKDNITIKNTIKAETTFSANSGTAERTTHSPAATHRRREDNRLRITPHTTTKGTGVVGHHRVSAIPSPISPRDDHRVSSMTMMLVTVSFVFCLTTLPISIYFITRWIIVAHGYDIPDGKVIWPVLTILMYTNNAVNFILYSLSGSKFRAEFKTLWHLVRKRLPRPNVFRRSGATLSSSVSSSRSGKSKSSVEIRRWSSNTETSTVESPSWKSKQVSRRLLTQMSEECVQFDVSIILRENHPVTAN